MTTSTPSGKLLDMSAAPRPPRPPRGHRQRGAGTVMVSKGPVKRDGLEIKDWQMTPKELLKRWCMNEKRPHPRYLAVDAPRGKFLNKVILSDSKDQKEKDVVVIPTKDSCFDTVVEAEHAVALLALQKVDGARAHEMKLPDPYREIWLKLVGRVPDKGAQGKEEEDEFVCEVCGKAFAKPHALVQHAKQEHPKPKTAPPMPADDRPTPSPCPPVVVVAAAAATVKSAPVVMVVKAPVPPIVPTVKATTSTPVAVIAKAPLPVVAKTLLPVVARTPPPLTLAASTPMTVAVRPPAPPPVKPNAAALQQLSARSSFATEQAKRLAINETARIKREREQRRKHREEEEDLDIVLMNDENRAALETLVRNAATNRSAMFEKTKTWSMDNQPDEEDQYMDLIENIVRKMGFDRTDARNAAYCSEGDRSLAMDWLFVHVPEERLPHGFDPKAAQLQVTVNDKASLGISETTAPSESDSTISLPPVSSNELAAWYGKHVEPFTSPGPINADADAGDWNAEWQVLESILADDVACVTESETMIKYEFQMGKLPRLEKNLASLLVLEIRFNPLHYPKTQGPTCIVMRGLQTGRASVSVSRVLANAITVGEPCAYALWEAARELTLEQAIREGDAAVAAAAASTTPAAAGNKSNDNRNGGGHYKNHRSGGQSSISMDERERQSVELARKYREKKIDPIIDSKRKRLPAFGYREKVIETVEKYRVVIIKGETGCGKTTQVPQYLLEHYVSTNKGGMASIVVTQPRRLAAISVAARVATEWGEDIGQTIGHRVQLDVKCDSKKTRLEFCTTGILLRRLQGDSSLKDLTHVVVDEVHERSLDSDFLLALLRTALKVNSKLKIILMSATMDADVFSRYFGGVPVLEIPGFTFPVKEYFLEDVLKLTSWSSVRSRTGEEAEDLRITIEKLESQLDFSFAATTVLHAHISMELEANGSILVFVSGVAEISNTIRACAEADERNELYLLPLHGALTSVDQRKAFDAAPRGKRKVIVSTNVAETSVTIDDVVCVVDTGRMKETRFDPATKMSSLVDCWVSKASARQRKGRAGRVREGICLKLFSSRLAMDAHQLAEVHRVPLEQCMLQVASMELVNELEMFFGGLVDPPQIASVRSAISSLMDIGAMDEKEKLTPLGKHLARLPLDARLGKMLIFGSLLGVAEDVATIAATLSRRSPFLNPKPEDRQAAQDAKREFYIGSVASGSQSDHLVLVSAFDAWKNCRGGERDRRNFAISHFLSHDGLRDMDLLRREFLNELQRLGFPTHNEKFAEAFSSQDPFARRRRLVKASLCAGLYPNVVRIKRPPKRYVETAGGALEADPTSRQLIFELVRFSAAATVGDEQEEPETPLPMDQAPTSTPTRRGQRVFLHPSSMNFETNVYKSGHLVYSEIVNTSKAFVRDSTCVAPYGLLLFGGVVEVFHEEGIITCGNRLRFRAAPRIAVLVKEVRKLLDALLLEKISTPDLDLAGNPVLDACKRLVEGDGYF